MEIFSIYPANEEGTDALPAPEVPYYVLAKEGLFLHRKTQIGTVLIKQNKMPDNATLSKIGHTNGVFTWIGPKIPGEIIAQATDFFRRIYAEHKTEAEVIITMHNDTGAFRLFVPYQRVSSAGVKSIYEPTFIDRNYTVVGTLHSHCNFSAFHSGTDSADAADMDGIHFTIGMLEKDIPEIVAMVVMNKKEFHYDKPEDVAEIQFEGTTAPYWWDQYVFPSTTEADKPKRMRSITQDQWNIFRGMTPVNHIKTATKIDHTPRPYDRSLGSYSGDYKKSNMGWGYDDDADWSMYPYAHYGQNIVPFQPTKDSEKFNKKFGKKQRHFIHSRTATDKAIDKAIDEGIEAGFVRSEDWGEMQASELDDISFWQKFYLDKLAAICDILEIINIDVEFNAAERTHSDLR